MAKKTDSGKIKNEGKKPGKTDWMARLSAFDTAVNDEVNPHEDVIRISRSPSVNSTFGNGHGLPRGYSLMIYGPNKGGKSVICYDTIGALHQDSPTAIAIRYNTELRERLQLTAERKKVYGIDSNRYKCFETNVADEIFDHFEKDVAAMCDDGMDLRLAIIDSTSNIQGRREETAESINNFQIGDHAQTIQIGLKRILPVIRKHRIALILVTHVRAEMDQTQIKRGNTVKAQASWGVKHFAEYFGYVERNDWASGQTTQGGEELRDPTLRDIRNDAKKGERIGHRLIWEMKENSCGPRGRKAEFILNYAKGITHQHEEVFLLAKARGIFVPNGNGSWFTYRDQRWNGEAAAMEALANSPPLQKEVMAEFRRRDMAGEWSADEVSTVDATGTIDSILDNAVPAAE